MLLLFLMLTPFLAALAIACAQRLPRNMIAWMAGLAPITGLVLLALLTSDVLAGSIPRASWEWMPGLGVNLSLRLDGLAWMFAGLVLGIGALIVLYAAYYLSEEDSAPRFFGFLMLFMGSMLGMTLSGNLMLLVVFWEMTSISSFLLIGFWYHRQDAREGARMALAITGGGGLAMLAGVLLLGHIVGSYELDVVLKSGEQILAHELYPVTLILILLGAFTKSAQFPFHFWLPHAMAAPTPVSAYLHSATMVKMGVFLLARLHPALAGSDLFFFLVSGVGAVTLLVGSWNAIFQHDLKGLLAYSTIAHLGLITLLFGLSTEMAVVAALFHILNHATFKASLFMAAGIIDHECGSRDMRELGGLLKLMPYTAILAIVASLAMAGIPLLNGFLSKEMFFTEALEIEGHAEWRSLMTAVAVTAGALGVAYSLRFVHDVFFGSWRGDPAVVPHGPPVWMRIPVEVLVVVCLTVGIIPAFTIAPVLHTAAVGVLGDRVPYYSLAIWHGINWPLIMSAAGVVGGVALYFGLRRVVDVHALSPRSIGFSLFHWSLGLLLKLSDRISGGIENGSLQRYLGWMVLAALLLGAAPFLAGGSLGMAANTSSQAMSPLGWLLWLLGAAGVIGTVWFRHERLMALIVIGLVGLVVSLTFVFLSAPDLALTQLLVEMVTITLLILALNFLPYQGKPETGRLRLWRDGVIALLAGGGAAALVYAVITRPLDTVASEMLLRSLSEGGGNNVVNVILVDFRGFDTLGEIAVFGIAGLVVHALLRHARMTPEEIIPGPPERLLIPTLVSQLLFPIALTVSIYLFLRGHNLPGGGFIAGLVLTVPLILQYVVSGSRYVEHRIGFDYARGIGAGVLIAAATGVGSFGFGYPFLTSSTPHPVLPIIGEIPLASALGFDIGVYLVVFSAAMLTLAMMGRIHTPPDPHAKHKEAA